MLEAERAGAKALVVFMGSYERNSPEWKVLRHVHEDEAHNCALIGELLKKSGTPYSHATGEFYDKAVAIQGPRERIAFLIKGLKWAIREFEQALPGIRDPEITKLFQQMRERHLRSVRMCETLVQN
jgi:nitronate monooxygenase